MAINKNHEFEELDGVKCAIVEKNVSKERTDFLKDLLEYNWYTVIVVPTASAKVTAPPAPNEGEPAPTTLPSAPETFTVGVTDVSFSATNAVFGRQLYTRNGHIVTLAYWQQKESVSHDEIPYYEQNS